MKCSAFFMGSRVGLAVLLAIGAAAGCARGNSVDSLDGEGSGGSSNGTTAEGAGATSTSSGGTTTGTGAGTTTGSTGTTSTSTGTGGTTSTSTSGGGSGAGGSSGSGGAASGLDGTASTMLTAFGGAANSAVVASAANLVNNTGFSTPFTEQTSERIGLAMTGTGVGVLVARALGSGELRYAVWNGNWSPGFGSPLSPVQAALTIVGGPSVAPTPSDKAHVAYQRDDLKFYYAAIQSGLWSPTQEPIGNGADQSTGPVPPSIATVGADPIVVYVGDDGDLYDRRRSGGVWQPANPHGIGGVAPIAPSVVTLASGPQLVVVFADAATHALQHTTFDGVAWSAPAPIGSAASDDVVSLAALPSEGAALAWRGTDAALHAAVYSPSDVPAWSEPAGLPGATLVGPPAVASGALGARAELIYVDTSYLVYGSRFVNGAWTAPALSGSSGERIALVTGL